MGLPAVTSILFGQIISPPLCVFDFSIQVRQFDYVTARNRLSGNVCFALAIGFQVPVGCDSMPSAELFTLGTTRVVIVGHAGAEHVDKGEAFVLQALLNQLSHVTLLAAEAAGHE